MANPLIRTRSLELLACADFTLAALANRLAVPYNSAAKAIARAKEEGQVHVCGTGARGAAIYRLGARPTLDPVVPASSSRDDWSLIRDPAVSASALEYFEYPELPNIKQFSCTRLKATLSVPACSDRWTRGNAMSPDTRCHACKGCTIGQDHAAGVDGGSGDHNTSFLRATLTCARCHKPNGRLIARMVCISCRNREYEWVRQKNSKGTIPRMHPPMARRTLSYRTNGELHRRSAMTCDETELYIATLRDEQHSVTFGWRAPASMDWLFDNDVYDRSTAEIGDACEAVDAPDVADSMPVDL
jgi:hypothetical protein